MRIAGSLLKGLLAGVLLLGAAEATQHPAANPAAKPSSRNPNSAAPANPSTAAANTANTATAQSAAANSGSTARFPAGKTLQYAVDWRLFSAGTATFRIENAGQEFRVLANADAVGVVAVLYHVHDSFESFVDARTLCSRAISKHTEEGFRRLETSITFDAGRKKAVLNERNLKNGERKNVEHDIPPCVEDAVSSLFYIGSLPLTQGQSYDYALNDGGTTATVHVTVEGKEQVKTPAGTFNTLRVQAIGTGEQRAKGSVQIWYTDDAQHLPVQMKARMFWGSLTFHLTSQSGR